MKQTAVLCAVAGLAAAANAQFSGVYDPANWTLNSNGGDGHIINNAPASVTVVGNDAGGSNISTDFTINVPASGTWSFDWNYFSSDTGDWDSGGYILNGTPVQLADNNTQGSGHLDIAVNAGDQIGYYVFSRDGGLGPGNLEITNFSAPIPTPGAVALVGLGGLIGLRRNRR